MGTQFSEEFLLGYRAGHRDGFADAVLRMRDAVTHLAHTRALAHREAELARLLSGAGLLGDPSRSPERADDPPEVVPPRP